MESIDLGPRTGPTEPPKKNLKAIAVVAVIALLAAVAIVFLAMDHDENPWVDCEGEHLPYFTPGEYYYTGTYWDYLRGDMDGKAAIYSDGWKITGLPITSAFEGELHNAEYKATQKRSGPTYVSPDGKEWNTMVYRITHSEVTFAGNLMVHMERHDEYIQMDFTMSGWRES